MNAIANAPIYDEATVAGLLKITFSEADLMRFAHPPAERDGYVTLFDPGWSINQLRQRFTVKNRIVGPRIFFYLDWYSRQPFASLVEAPRYRQLRSEPVEGSFRKTMRTSVVF